MALGITAHFTRLAPCRTPLWLSLLATAYRTQEAEPGVFAIWFEAVSVDGDTVQLMTSPALVLDLTCATAPDDSGTQYAPGSTLEESAQFLYEALLTNSQVTARWTLDLVDEYVYFIGRETGITFVSCTFSDDRGSGDVVSNDEPATYQANYSTVLRPNMLIDGVWKLLPESAFSPTPDTLLVQHDISEQLLGPLKPDWPPVGQTGVAITNVKSCRPFFLEVWERYGDPILDRAVQRIGSEAIPFMAWLAGWERVEWSAYTPLTNRFLGLTAAPHPFLTWRNRKARREVTTFEQHYLGWYHWPMDYLGGILRMEACLTHTDEVGQDPVTTVWSIRYSVSVDPDVPRERISTWSTGYTQLELAELLPEGRKAHKYSVRITSGSGPKSEELTFWLSDSDHNEIYLQFISSLGIVESMRTTGAWSRPEEHAHQELQRAASYAQLQSSELGRHTAYPLGAQRTLTVFTGYHAITEHQALMDILGSVDVKFMDHASGRRTPLRFLKGSEVVRSKRGENDESLHSLELQFACDDPSAITTMPILGGEVVHHENDDWDDGEGEEMGEDE